MSTFYPEVNSQKDMKCTIAVYWMAVQSVNMVCSLCIMSHTQKL